MAFVQWLERQDERDDPIGDLARDWNNDREKTRYFGKPTPRPSYGRLRSYLRMSPACPEAVQALRDAYLEWQQQKRENR